MPFSRRVVLLALLVTTLVTIGDRPPLVLCIEPDGDMRLEDGSRGCCGDPAPEGSPHEDRVSVRDGACCPCTDLPLPSVSSVLPGPPARHATAHEGTPAPLHAPSPTPCLVAPPSRAPFKPPRDPDRGRSQQGQGTTILRC